MLDECEKFKGIVVAIKANYLIVEIDSSWLKVSQLKNKREHSFRLLCTLRKKLLHQGFAVHVGDDVFVESINWSLGHGVISKLEPRKSCLTRPQIANATEFIVVLSLKDPVFDYNQASRFLLTAEQSGLKVSLILTKLDLISSNEVSEKIQYLTAWGYKPTAVSIKNGKGIDAFLQQIRLSKLAVLCGPSGTGKSSLLNHIMCQELITIGSLSTKLKRGKNTTRHVQLYSLAENTLVADTPGFNRPEIKIEPVKLQTLFPEIRSQIKDCRCKFRDCLHRDEPGCVVDKSWQRYSEYRKLLDEMINSHR